MDYDKTIKQLKKRLADITEDQEYYAELLYDSVKSYCDAEKLIEKRGRIISSGERLFINPSITDMNEAHKQILKLLKLLGISETRETDNEGLAFLLPPP